MVQKICLVITPLDASGSRVTDTIKRALNDVDIIPLTISPGALVGETILSALQRADIVVVDISRQNPNVMYELGFAHAQRKPTILIVNRKATVRLPNYLGGYLFISYDEKNLKSLKENISQLASKMLIKEIQQ